MEEAGREGEDRPAKTWRAATFRTAFPAALAGRQPAGLLLARPLLHCWPSSEEPPGTAAIPRPPSPELQHRRQRPGTQRPKGGTHLPGSFPSMDSGSHWEEDDEVFYN
ncbi:Protein FAM131C [Plecturocebus cupreus]